MKIGFYSPYFSSLSGGERYVLTLASHWSKTHDVRIFCDDHSLLKKARKRFAIDLSRVKTTENVFGTRNVFKKMLVSSSYDLLFFLTDGSVPTTFAKHNILHFQVPFRVVRAHPIKLSRFQAVVCNSDFTKRHLDTRLGKHSRVIFPPVSPISSSSKAKKNIILSVGRIHPVKKQDVLIEAFRKARTALKDYSLVLAGGLQDTDKLYLKRLQMASRRLPITILPNVTHERLTSLYKSASIYWHAAGFRINNPEHMEHFGITAVEAMSAEAVPVVYNGGGLPEIVKEGESGFLWANIDDLIKKTLRVIEDPKLRFRMAKEAQKRSNDFSVTVFTKQFDSLKEEIMT